MNTYNEYSFEETKRRLILINHYKLYEFLIALCMPIYNRKYLNPLNFGTRLYVIHNYTNCYKIKAPILNAAKFCDKYWCPMILDFYSCHNPGIIDDESFRLYNESHFYHFV